jgi:predicted RNase H-like HicB family nuclease
VTHYIAMIEEEEGKAVGVWFPDLPGCTSAGDTVDEAIVNAREALALYAESIEEYPQEMPAPRSFYELKQDQKVISDLKTYQCMLALIELNPHIMPSVAAE